MHEIILWILVQLLIPIMKRWMGLNLLDLDQENYFKKWNGCATIYHRINSSGESRNILTSIRRREIFNTLEKLQLESSVIIYCVVWHFKSQDSHISFHILFMINSINTWRNLSSGTFIQFHFHYLCTIAFLLHIKEVKYKLLHTYSHYKWSLVGTLRWPTQSWEYY